MIQSDIIGIAAQIASIRDSLTSVGINYDKISVITSPANSFEDAMVKLLELEKRQEEMFGKLNEARDDAVLLIEKLEPSKQRDVLYHRYVQQLDYKSIADIMGYTEQRVYQLRREGMAKLDENIIVNYS